MFVFKSDSHRIMFHNVLKLQIKSRILSRFGGMSQEECQLLKTRSFKDFISLWSNLIINKLPNDSNTHSEYINSQINTVSQEVLDQPSVKDMMTNDPSLKWVIERINSNNDDVPKPYFPSVLRNQMIQFPFKHHDIQKSRDLYGLLKFPFYKLSTSLYGDPSESFKGLVEPKSSCSDSVNDDSSLESNKSEYSSNDLPSQSSKTDEHSRYCSSNYIYSPSELETGLKEA